MFLPQYHGAYIGQTPFEISTRQSINMAEAAPLPLPKTSVIKARSTNSLRTLAAMQAAEMKEQQSSFHTIRDPRMASTSDLSRKSSTSQLGDNKDEVAVLSDKLISAINHQQTLDDSLAEARHDLESERAKSQRLEAKIQEYESKATRKQSSEDDTERLRAQLEDIRKQNDALTQEKRSLQTEMDDLSASLFEEANKQVATANEQKAAVEKRNQQLKDQIKDGEALVASQTEQLKELKLLMQDIGSEYKKEATGPDTPKDMPTSPMMSRDENVARLLEAMNLSPVTPDHPAIAPSPSTQLTHLVKPLCRTDIPSYDDFKQMLSNTAHRSHTPSHAPSRAGSGSYAGLSGLGLGGMTQNNSSSPNLSSQASANAKLAASPGLPGSFSPAPDQKGPQPLKDTRFFKRIMLEDIEPTLRLDLSPQISWLQRRSLLASVSDSTLIVEPIPEASIKLYGKYTSCSVCGECRKENENPRTHAMRTRDGEGANKWAICKLCLEKVRAVGDLIGYIRMVRDGVVKIVDLKDEEEVWEEIIRLRERLFWARLAGGVVPAFLPTAKPSPITVRPDAQGTESNTENGDAGFKTPETGSRRTSEDEEQANLQLQSTLDESLTTFDNAKERVSQNAKQTPNTPTTSSHKSRESTGSNSGFPKISIPKMPSLPQGFWDGQVNALH